MATGTVSLHSWNDGAEDDEALPSVSSNYNARLEPRKDFDSAMRRGRDADEAKGPTITRSRAGGRGLRSNIVRPARLGAEDAEAGDGGSIW